MKPLVPDQEAPPDTKMGLEDLFHFECSPDIPCFTRCCRDINIFLSPYDLLRLKRGLGISSDEFLERYTLTVPGRQKLIPLVVLKMNEEDKTCPFVSPEGCTVYQDRPWACRMYPLDVKDDGSYTLVTDPSHCRGLAQGKPRPIREWLTSQGIRPYEEANAHVTQLWEALQRTPFDIDNPDIAKMAFMALYNLDEFRRFVFESSFLQRFEIEKETVYKVKRSDLALLHLGIDWIYFGLLGKKVFPIKETAASPRRKDSEQD